MNLPCGFCLVPVWTHLVVTRRAGEANIGGSRRRLRAVREDRCSSRKDSTEFGSLAGTQKTSMQYWSTGWIRTRNLVVHFEDEAILNHHPKTLPVSHWCLDFTKIYSRMTICAACTLYNWRKNTTSPLVFNTLKARPEGEARGKYGSRDRGVGQSLGGRSQGVWTCSRTFD